jgi:RND family efflux transporter MFP subunit
LKYTALLFIGTSALIIYILFGYKQERVKRKNNPAPLVQLAQVKKGSFSSVLNLRGHLVSKSKVVVRTRISGIVENLFVEMGHAVQGKQLLVELDDTEARLRLAQTKADTQVAQGIVEQAEINYDVAKDKLTLNQKLREKKVISQSDLDKSIQEVKKLDVGLKITQAKKEQVDINYQRAKVNLDNCTIRSPWADKKGWVSEVHVNTGHLLSNNGAVVTIVDLETILAVAYVTENDYARLKVGQETEVSVQSFKKNLFCGNIFNISPSFDAKSRQAKFEISIDNSKGELRPGMMARISIDTGTRNQLTLIPVEATIYYRGKQGVFLYDEEREIAVFKNITLGKINDGFAEVIKPKGLSGRVVTIGNHMLRSGRKVRIEPDKSKTISKKTKSEIKKKVKK